MPGDKVKVRVVHPVAARSRHAVPPTAVSPSPTDASTAPSRLTPRASPAPSPDDDPSHIPTQPPTHSVLTAHIPPPASPPQVSSSVVVFHVPKSKGAATDLMGMEGVVDSRADEHEGKYISANLEIRVALPVPDDPKGKTFIAHMREDEVEAL